MAAKFHVFSLRLDPDTYKELMTYAQVSNINRTDAVRQLIEFGLETARLAKCGDTVG